MFFLTCIGKEILTPTSVPILWQHHTFLLLGEILLEIGICCLVLGSSDFPWWFWYSLLMCFCDIVFSLLFIYTGLILLSRVSSIPLPTLLSTNQFFLNASMFYIESKFVIEFSVIFFNSAYFLSIVFLSILVTPRFWDSQFCITIIKFFVRSSLQWI